MQNLQDGLNLLKPVEDRLFYRSLIKRYLMSGVTCQACAVVASLTCMLVPKSGLLQASTKRIGKLELGLQAAQKAEASRDNSDACLLAGMLGIDLAAVCFDLLMVYCHCLLSGFRTIAYA